MGSNWFTADHSLARYWSNGPDDVAKAMRQPIAPTFEARTLEDMSREEIEALEAHYRCPVAGRDSLPAFRSPAGSNTDTDQIIPPDRVAAL